jgi:serine kinase of HPr protein (carbohydrate metabolism regulator)
MSGPGKLLLNTTVVEIGGRALALEGSPGCGKSSLALALIDRGAGLIGDDGVQLNRHDEQIVASPPPRNAGLLEIRGVGVIELPAASIAPLALILALGESDERLPQSLAQREILGCRVPVLPFDPGTMAPALRAEYALRTHGLDSGRKA